VNDALGQQVVAAENYVHDPTGDATLSRFQLFQLRKKQEAQQAYEKSRAASQRIVDTATACLLSSTAGTRKEIVEITAPVVGANNGINVYMCVDGYNVDGSNGKTSLDGMAVGIMDTTSTAKTVGCGTAVLA